MKNYIWGKNAVLETLLKTPKESIKFTFQKKYWLG